MVYQSSKGLRPGNYPDAKGLAVVLPVRLGDEPAIVTHEMDEPMFVFAGGSHQWHCGPLAGMVRWGGLIVEGVEIEVDIASRFDPTRMRARQKGVLIFDDGGLGLFARLERQGAFPEDRFVVLQAGDKPPEDRAVAFAKWRLVRRDGDNVHELLKFEAEIPQS